MVSSALFREIPERRSDSCKSVCLLIHGASRDRDDPLYDRLSLIAGLIDGVASAGRDDRASDSCGQSARFYFPSGYGLDLVLFASLRILHLFGNYLYAVFLGMEGIQDIDCVLLVDLYSVISLVETRGDPCTLNAFEQLLRICAHGNMVTVQIRLTLGSVDYQRVDLSESAFDLECSRKHGAAHSDYPCVAHPLKDRFTVFQFLFSQRCKIRAWSVLVVVFDHDSRD